VFPPSSILLLVSCLWLRLGAYLQCGQDKVCTSGHSKLGWKWKHKHSSLFWWKDNKAWGSTWVGSKPNLQVLDWGMTETDTVAYHGTEFNTTVNSFIILASKDLQLIWGWPNTTVSVCLQVARGRGRSTVVVHLHQETDNNQILWLTAVQVNYERRKFCETDARYRIHDALFSL